jgi:hypothetical protein
MDRLARFLAIALLAIFAVSMIAHGARATTMVMSHLEMADSMGDCDGCPSPDDGKMPFCGQVCLAPFAALPAPADIEFPVVATDVATSALKAMSGLSGPPDPHPPRTTISA